jgi:LmbE family N-acetylglucosaminyl deacetylase
MLINKILILAPHTDDGELGCGGTIAKFIEEGKQVYYVAFSICEESVPEGFPKNILSIEVKKATKKLGIKPDNLTIKNYRVRNFPSKRQSILEDLVELNKQIQPDLVFAPSSFDVHQDHKTIFEETRRAFRNCSIFGYEFIWNNFSFGSSSFILLEERHIQKKVSAMDQYESQTKRLYSKDTLIKGLANFRGLQVGAEYAEAFEVIRLLIK